MKGSGLKMKFTGINERKTLKEMMDIHPDTFALVIDPDGYHFAQDTSSFSGIFYAVTDGPRSEREMYDLYFKLRDEGKRVVKDVSIPGPKFESPLYGENWKENWKRY